MPHRPLHEMVMHGRHGISWARGRASRRVVPLCCTSTQDLEESMDDRDDVPRQVLPIAARKRVGLTTYDAKDPDTKFPPIRPLRPPTGAPNVLIVLLDDVSFGASTALGGPCHTPTAERLAAGGLKYNRFHTPALCSPTRAA